MKKRYYKHSNQFIKDRLDFKKGNTSITDYDSEEEKEQAKPVFKSLQSCIAEARHAAKQEVEKLKSKKTTQHFNLKKEQFFMTQDQRSTRESVRTSSINIGSPKNNTALNRSQNKFFANRLSTQTPKIRDYIQITNRRKLDEITSKNQALLSKLDSKYASEVKIGSRTHKPVSKRNSCIHALSDTFKG